MLFPHALESHLHAQHTHTFQTLCLSHTLSLLQLFHFHLRRIQTQFLVGEVVGWLIFSSNFPLAPLKLQEPSPQFFSPTLDPYYCLTVC